MNNIVRRLCSGNSNKAYFITTPIYYVNAAPHLGHLYSSVIADAIQRWYKLYKPNNNGIIFSTGTDEHGLKIQQSAFDNKTTLENYCRNVSNQYKHLFDSFDINYTNFIRTTDVGHKEAVQQFWSTIDRNGHIYSSHYCGWYSVADETFLAGSQLKEIQSPDGTTTVSMETGHPVEWTEEQNYMFRLSSFQDDIVHWLRTNESSVKPSKFHKQLLELAQSEDVGDVSISRPASRVHWGIPVPGDATHNIYVWMDALVNYLTVAGYPAVDSDKFTSIWPPDVQVIGKDILKFHGIYWPAFLMAAGLEPPRTILCHSHWTVDGAKMSKSKNNVICPLKKKSIYTADGIRYFLLREGVSHSDGNYSETKIMRILNSELADTLGNLLSRCCGTILNPKQVYPQYSAEMFETICDKTYTKYVLHALKQLPGDVEKHYTEYNFYKAIDCIIGTLHTTNSFFEHMKPWHLRRTTEIIQLNAVLYLTMESLRVCGILLQPILPTLSATLLNKLNVPQMERYFTNAQIQSEQNTSTEERSLIKQNEPIVIYKRILLDNHHHHHHKKLGHLNSPQTV